MSEKLASISKNTKSEIEKKQTIPIIETDLAIFDDTLTFLRDKFAEEMKRVDEQMLRLGKALINYNNQELTVQTGLISESSKDSKSIPEWEEIIDSPLVHGEGDDKIMKLQFDVSQFEPSEITVRVSDCLLKVSATHQEKDDKSSIYREYNRQFILPRGTDPESITSTLSPDGVLTVEAPLKLIRQDTTPIK